MSDILSVMLEHEPPHEWCYSVLGNSLCTLDGGAHFYRVPPPVEIGGRNAD